MSATDVPAPGSAATDGHEPYLTLRDWTLTQRGHGASAPLLTGLDLELRPGCWVAVAGANGSGKSSLLAFLAGPSGPLRVPVSWLPQDPDDQFVAASVAAELALGRDNGAVPPAGFGLEPLLDRDPRLLSAGQKQRLALAVALGSSPKVLLCDEPTALQDAAQAAWVLDHLDDWRRRTGGCLVTATCDRREAARADELLVLEAGRVVAHGPAGAVLAGARWRDLLDDEPDPAEAGAGAGAGITDRRADFDLPTPARQIRDGATPALRLRGVGCRIAGSDLLAGIDLDLPPGARLGLCGPNGCGKSTLLAICAGARRPDAGEVWLGSRRLYGRGALDTGHGLALLAPQFPEYLFSRATVRRELAVDPALAARDPVAFVRGLGLPPSVVDRHPRDLSSGQQRRLALGLVLLSGRPLLLIDEPTVALDGPGRRLVRQLLAAVPAEAAVVVASHDHRFLTGLGCDVRVPGPTGLRPA